MIGREDAALLPVKRRRQGDCAREGPVRVARPRSLGAAVVQGSRLSKLVLLPHCARLSCRFHTALDSSSHTPPPLIRLANPCPTAVADIWSQLIGWQHRPVALGSNCCDLLFVPFTPQCFVPLV